MDVEKDWVEDRELPPILRARILALKVCRNRCLAHGSAIEVATPALDMFTTLLQLSGSFKENALDRYVYHPNCLQGRPNLR